MPIRHARALAPLAVTLLVGLAGMGLGLGRRTTSGRPRPNGRPEPEPPPLPSGMRRSGPTRLLRSAILGTLALVVLTGAAIYAGYQMKLSKEMRTRAIALTAGNPDFGRDLARRYGCAGCHTIPGVPHAKGQVGPSLQGFAARVYVGGVTTNTPDSLIQWIENPRSLDPKSAMPITGISRQEARHVAAYLYTLR
ncbi:c-type cytochrome [Microvirga aerophila]|uniref:c-type cytochrome n=1 Tax=Microvirga aerophila TaxID=670291 RepID=UPI001FF02DD4|nr:c-type cytochrome [Microvirga aerophila]